VICSSGVGFDPHQNDRELTFGFHGIWQGVAVLYDKQTKSLWMHLTGECIDGPLEGEKVDLITGRHVQWGEWRRDHPTTRVMCEDPFFRANYAPEENSRRGQDFFPRMFMPTIDHLDERLSPSALCYGVKTKDAARAYPFAELMKVQGGVVNGHVGETPVVLVFESETRSAAAHSRLLDQNTLVFERGDDGLLIDVDSKSRFDRDGLCIEGEYLGQRLQALGLQAEWYGWFATYPETTIFAHPNADVAE
jgi:hypothetical protein